jgi:hypothetical protein
MLDAVIATSMSAKGCRHLIAKLEAPTDRLEVIDGAERAAAADFPVYKNREAARQSRRTRYEESNESPRRQSGGRELARR